MSFDGIQRPSQLNPYSDPLNPSIGAYAAAQEAAHAPQVRTVDKKRRLEATKEKFDPLYDEETEEEPETLSEEEKEQIQIFAKLRGLLNFSLKEGAQYKFHIDPEAGLVNLVAEQTGEVVLRLTPEELIQICGKLKRYAGMMADREG